MLHPLQAASSWLFDDHDDRPGFACLKFSAATVLAATFAVVTIGTCINDVRIEQILDRRGVTAEAAFLDSYCGRCSSLPVQFVTRDGQVVKTDLSVTGDPDDDTVLVRYDPQHPVRAHPANGVVSEEVETAMLGIGSLLGLGYALRELLLAARMVRARRHHRWPGSGVTAQASHVKVVHP